jgi:hypothetical protein
MTFFTFTQEHVMHPHRILLCFAALLATSTAIAQFTPTPVPFGRVSRNAAKPTPAPQQGSLHQASNTDNTATVDLPNGWSVLGGSNGAIDAAGPGPAYVHLGFVIPGIYDTDTPQAQNSAMLAFRNHTPIIQCRHDGEPLSTLYRCVVQQKRKNANLKPQTIRTLTTRPAGPTASESKALLMETNTFIDDGSGNMETTIRVGATDLNANGQYDMTVSGIQAPKEVFEQNRPLLAAIVSSYRRNGRSTTAEMQPILDNIDSRGSTAPVLPSAHDASPPQ